MKRIGQWAAFIPGIVRSWAGPTVKSYVTALPEGYPASRIRINLSIPPLPRRAIFEFSEHVMDVSGSPTNRVLAASVGRFAVSDDLGCSWREVKLSAPGVRILHVKNLGEGEFLVQTFDASASAKAKLADLSVVNARGESLAHFPKFSVRWHGSRAAAHAHGTLMFAEYPQNKDRKWSSRVFRSRDRGRTWDVVFQQTGMQIRHFHFLQPRPGVRGEWWLTSGDHPHECRIWISRDDGDTWTDLTAHAAPKIEIGGRIFARDVFRLTDLAWEGDAVVWGTDDILQQTRADAPQARVFRSSLTAGLQPQELGRGKWHFRSLVDIGSCYLLLSQGNPDGCISPGDCPGVYLAPKAPPPGSPALIHLFDIETHASVATKLTASRASRAAKDGIFFTLRGRADVFSLGHRVLQWNVAFE